MYCRKCLKESEGKIKINMNSEIEEQCYLCPECGHMVEWNKEEEE